jgi:hypothetical protein
VTCANGQNFDARGRMFSDRWMIGSCGGMGAAAGRLINGRFLEIRTIQWREQLGQSVDLFFH